MSDFSQEKRWESMMATKTARKAGGALGLMAVLSLSVLILGASPEKERPVPKRVLFIGNSYTAVIRKDLVYKLAHSPYKQTAFEFITKGGATLQQHLADPQTRERIRTGKWDFVVLQDQSQRPALPGKHALLFHKSVDQFTALIRSAGAEPVLLMTWGRRDGDLENKGLFPDYTTMQKKLSGAYRTAAKRNKVLLAPVGQAWAMVQKQDKTLWSELYTRDGSHPSPKGAHLASSVFFRLLFHDSLESVQAPGSLKDHERRTIREAALNVCRANQSETEAH